jgi:glycosyltransferase involved in cell wall biosynthesis
LTNDPDLTVVIPVHNNASTLDAQLRAVLESAGAATEVVVVNNCSSDDSGAVAETWASHDRRLKIVEANARASEGYARNVGVAAASAAAIAFCDGDDVVGPRWVSAMTDQLSTHEFVTGPLDTDTLNPPWLAPMRGRRLFESMPMLFDNVPFAHGCNFGVRRRVFSAVGEFREDMPAGMDIEFSIRLWRATIALTWRQEALVHYRLRTDARARWRQSTAYGRAQPSIEDLIPEYAGGLAAWARDARRAGWLMRNALRIKDTQIRTRWLWTCGLLVGDVSSRIRSHSPSAR